MTEWTENIFIIYKNESVPFHVDQSISDWTEKKPGFIHFSAENGNYQFPRMLCYGKCNCCILIQKTLWQLTVA